MIRFVLVVIFGAFIGSSLPITANIHGGQALGGHTLFALDDRPKAPAPKNIPAYVAASAIAPKSRSREIIPPKILARKKQRRKELKLAKPLIENAKPLIKNAKNISGQKLKEKKKAEYEAQLHTLVNKKNQPPPNLRPLSKKTIVIDARRLTGHKITETIRYIKDNPNIRLKLQNATINPELYCEDYASFSGS